MILKSFILIALLSISITKAFSQITFNEAISYIQMPPDSLDQILTKKGYSFLETVTLQDNAVNASWKNNQSFRIGISATPDTVTILSEGKYVGNTDVLKKSLIFAFTGTKTYEDFISGLKKQLSRLQSWTEGSSIVTTYQSDQYFARVTKKVQKAVTYYFIRIDDLAYEILDPHYN